MKYHGKMCNITKKRLIFLIYKEYLQISMVKITIHGESLDNHMNDLEN